MKIAKTMIFLLIGILSFQLYAGDAPLDLTTKLDFRCTTTWGWDIDNMATGFETVINWLSLSFTPIGWKTHENRSDEEGKPHFYFTVTGLDLTIISISNEYGTAKEDDIGYGWLNYFNLTAKLVVDPLWIGVIMQGDGKQQTWNYDEFISDRAFIGSRTLYRALQAGGMGSYYIEDDPSIREYWIEKYRDLFQAYYSTSGRVLIGYDNDFLSVIGKIGSKYPWYDTADPNYSPNQYAFGIDAIIKPIDGLKLGFDVYYGATYEFNDGDPMFALKATYDIPVMGQIVIQPFAAFDDKIHSDGMEMEFVGGINIPWPGGGYQVDPIYILDQGSPNELTLPIHAPDPGTPRHRYTKSDTFGGLTLGGSYAVIRDPITEIYETRTLIDLSIFEAQGDEGLFLDMGMVLSAQLYNFLGTPEYGIGFYCDYEILDDMFRPIVAAQYQNYDENIPLPAIAGVDNLDIHIGIHYIDIPGATIGIELESGNLLASTIVIGTTYVFLSLNY